MTGPIRIQRQRTAGWRMPPNTVYVGRPSPCGNPFKAGVHYDHQHAVDLFQACTRKFPVDQGDIRRWKDAGGSAALLMGIASGALLEDLKGKNLACWCDLDRPCHAEVLLKLANKPVCEVAS
jgi:hypothetical protein